MGYYKGSVFLAGFKVQGLGFKVWGLGFRVPGVQGLVVHKCLPGFCKCAVILFAFYHGSERVIYMKWNAEQAEPKHTPKPLNIPKQTSENSYEALTLRVEP